ncbi:molecular chaperone HscC [Methylopila capsulata]|uniref:Molecular chaperone HscC n=1 Tax=Methylopila capsulata TaxID=61654 RepID=A0A9W6MTA8_9HYPH|nr:molecular chaperone HscC [Methylopila capsulata]MBM7852863.1 molecular chaperone HscC [Methylopila capsulata]GLK57072.1 molecular chaperone HscC [Methylopila capsulata]
MIVGIDLGTTHSLIGAYLDDGPQLFPNASGGLLTPSAVSVDEDGGVLVGEGARDRLLTQPDRSVAHFKRWMGAARETALGNRRFRPEELSSLVLRSLVADAEAATGVRPTEAVISVPAYFSDAQRTATRTAGEMAGLRVDRLINEPTAAALAYGLHERRGEGRFLVFDLGGGTLDVSIVEMFDDVVEVHATAGDNFLGGEDFLDVLVAAALDDLKIAPEAVERAEMASLRRRIERLKTSLSQAAGAASVELVAVGRAHAWSIDEARFALLAEPLMQRLRIPLERTLRDANLGPSDLDEVILVGGATRMPMVVRAVSRLLGRLPLRHVDPDHAIARGAVVASGLKARSGTLKEVILTDVCPYTLGTDVVRQDGSGGYHPGFLLPIITRGSTVPVSREQEVSPVEERQTKVEFNVFQGENPIAEKNVKLGSLLVPIPAAGPNVDRGVLLRFTYDVNGILQVEAKVKATGATHELILRQSAGALSERELRDRLAALAELKVHPREKQENLALMARAERLYEEQLVDRDRLQAMMLAFRGALESQDERRIRHERSAFADALADIERVR